jgi:hypothetical protein
MLDRTTAIRDSVIFVSALPAQTCSKCSVWRFDIAKQQLTRLSFVEMPLASTTAEPVVNEPGFNPEYVIPLCQVTTNHTVVLGANASNALYTTDLSTDRVATSPVTASSSTAGTVTAPKHESVPISAQLFAGGIKLDRKTVERAPDGVLIGGAGFGLISNALVSTKYEIEQRPCLYVLDGAYNAIRRIELPADWSILPDL